MAKVNDFAQELSDKYGLSYNDASDFISKMFDVVNEELTDTDSSVKIKGLGTFKVSAVSPRASVDVNTGERIVIEGRNKISFTPEVLLRDRVNRPFVQFETVILNDGVDFSGLDNEEESPMATCSSEETPSEENHSEETPSEEKYSEETPSEETPSEETPSEQCTETVEGIDIKSEENESSEQPVEPKKSTSAVNTDEYREIARKLMPQKSEAVDNGNTAEDESVNMSGVCKQRSPRLMYIISIASFFVLLILAIGMYFLYIRMEEKNKVIAQLESHIYSNTTNTVKPTNTAKPTSTHNAVAPDSVARKDTVDTHKSHTTNREEVNTSPEASVATSPSDYNYDVRVRTGAYIIVGVEKTVTVQQGQTLSSISKAYLGEGMECYVEVLNNRTTLKAGETLKIPRLKLKPRKK